MKRLCEPYLVAEWLVYFIIYGFALKWIIAALYREVPSSKVAR